LGSGKPIRELHLCADSVGEVGDNKHVLYMFVTAKIY
jgi:hypothetical protein